MAERVAGPTAGRWLDVKLAAEELGISSDAVRKRIARGTLRSSKDDVGSVRVWLDSADEGLDADQSDNQPLGWTEAGHRLGDLIDAKDETLRDLRDQLEHMRRESERKDAIIMQLSQASAVLAARVPELEPPAGPRDATETTLEGTDRRETHTEPQEHVQHRSWLYRFFFGP